MSLKTKRRLLLGAILLSSCLTTLADAPVSGQVAPAWQLQDLEGKAVQLSDFKGKVVVLNFWATWCPPCRAEIPALISLQQQYSPQGLVVIGVALDQGGAAVVKPFVKKMEIDYLNVIGDQKTARAYGGITVVPTTFIIDREGKISTEQKGAADRDAFEAEIKPLL